MKRRNFIKLTSAVSVATLLPAEVFSMFKAVGMDNCPNVNNRKLVLIQLAGANDGLNTLVPMNQYDLYAALRPNIKLSNTGTNVVINLDSTLSLSNQVGLHPVMIGFKNMYDSGFMRVIQGVGYPLQNKSHFKSTDLWLTGGDGTSNNNALTSGWTGRFLENYYANFLNANFPLAIELGSSDNSLGFHGEEEHGMSLNISGQDPAGFYNIVNGLGGAAPATIPDSEYGDLIQYILDNDTSTNVYAQTISNAFNAGSNSGTYPNTSLANQLKSVARFISGGLQTKVYLVKIGGFDTHNSQVASATETHTGNHANLLQQVSDAVNVFINDLNAQNLGDDVVAITFSEFGRKAGENGSLGTDHGEIAPMFVFGKGVASGVSGTNVNLSEAVAGNNYQIQTVQHDYRRVFGTVLQDWLGTSTETLDLSFYDNTNNIGFATQKITPFFDTNAIVPESCYTNQVLSNTKFKNDKSLVMYPNPASESVTFESIPTENIYQVEIYSLDGKLVTIAKNASVSNKFTVNVNSMINGVYIVNIITSTTKTSKKLVIRR